MSLLPFGAAALLSTAEAAEPAYDVTGGQAFEISVSGHKVVQNGVAYLALTEVADENFRMELLALMGEGNSLNSFTPGSPLLFRLGCATDEGLKSDSLIVSNADNFAYQASSPKNPISVVLGFTTETGTDGKCVSFADSFRVTSDTTN